MAERPANFQQIKKDNEICVRDIFDGGDIAVLTYVLIKLSGKQIKKPRVVSGHIRICSVSFIDNGFRLTTTVHHIASTNQQ